MTEFVGCIESHALGRLRYVQEDVWRVPTPRGDRIKFPREPQGKNLDAVRLKEMDHVLYSPVAKTPLGAKRHGGALRLHVIQAIRQIAGWQIELLDHVVGQHEGQRHAAQGTIAITRRQASASSKGDSLRSRHVNVIPGKELFRKLQLRRQDPAG